MKCGEIKAALNEHISTAGSAVSMLNFLKKQTNIYHTFRQNNLAAKTKTLKKKY